MATRRAHAFPVNPRLRPYLVLAAVAAIPILVFAVAGVSSDTFSLRGPAGPALAFSAGLLSFVSPCVLPLVPVYLTHLSGASIEQGRIVADRRRTFTHALVFVAAFSLVFIILGSSVGLLGSFFIADHQRDFERWSGVVLVLMGVVLIPAYGRQSPFRSAVILLVLTAAYFFIAQVAELEGQRTRLLQLGVVMLLAWLRFSGYLELRALSRTFQLDAGRGRGVGYSRSALVGGAFALGWTPCIGPILASILTLAATSDNALTGTYLLVAYSAGLAVPFLIAGLAVSDATKVLRRMQRWAPAIEVASGLLLIAVGTFLITGRLTGLNQYFSFADFNQGL